MWALNATVVWKDKYVIILVQLHWGMAGTSGSTVYGFGTLMWLLIKSAVHCDTSEWSILKWSVLLLPQILLLMCWLFSLIISTSQQRFDERADCTHHHQSAYSTAVSRRYFKNCGYNGQKCAVVDYEVPWQWEIINTQTKQMVRQKPAVITHFGSYQASSW